MRRFPLLTFFLFLTIERESIDSSNHTIISFKISIRILEEEISNKFLAFLLQAVKVCEIGNSCGDCEIEYYSGKLCRSGNSPAYSLLRCNEAVG